MKLTSAVAIVALFSLSACMSGPDLAAPLGASGTSAARVAGSGSSAMTGMTVGDQAFLTQAAYGGLGEVAFGALAAEKATSPAVRQFGRQMVTQHQTANQELVALAKSKGMTPPTAPDTGRQAAAEALGMLDNLNFDRQYLQQQLMEHEVAIALYQAQARAGTDTQVRAFASKWLPTLQAHAEEIRSLTRSASGLS